MNFIPNKHELKRGIFIQQREFPERKERERGERGEIILNFKIFCVTNVKYKEISWTWRIRKGRGGEGKK